MEVHFLPKKTRSMPQSFWEWMAKTSKGRLRCSVFRCLCWGRNQHLRSCWQCTAYAQADVCVAWEHTRAGCFAAKPLMERSCQEAGIFRLEIIRKNMSTWRTWVEIIENHTLMCKVQVCVENLVMFFSGFDPSNPWFH